MQLKRSLKAILPQSGFIMFNTMMTVFVLAVFSLIFGRAVSYFRHQASFQISQIEFKTNAYSKIYEALFKIMKDNAAADHLKESWNFQEQIGEDGSIKVEDESGKISLKSLKSKDKDIRQKNEKCIRQLLSAKGIPFGNIESLLDEVKREKNLKSLDSLKSYTEAGPGDRECLSRFLTVYSDGKININTASREVLEVLLAEENLFLVKEILSGRQKEPFLDLHSFEDADENLRELLSVNSSYFTVTISNESHLVLFKVVIRRSLGEIKIIEWNEK